MTFPRAVVCHSALPRETTLLPDTCLVSHRYVRRDTHRRVLKKNEEEEQDCQIDC
jgi:hypothetical protein